MTKKVKNAKFEFTGETKVVFGVTLNRIRAVTTIAAIGVAAGDVGGWIEREENLSAYGNAWVSGDARVQTVNIAATRTDGYTFLVAPTPDGPRIIAGCRYFTFKEAETHWGAGYRCEKLGAESRSIIRHLKTMAKLNSFDKPVKEEA